MGPDAARQPLESPGEFEEPRELGRAARLPKLRHALHRLPEAHSVGDQLGETIHLWRRQLEHPAHVADHQLRLHGPERHDLRHPVAAVGLGHVVEHLFAPNLAKVHIDVRRADPFRIEEPLEQQTVSERVDVGDAQGVGDEAARRRTAPRAHRDLPILGEAHEILHDEEIGRVPGPPNDVKFHAEALLVVGTRRPGTVHLGGCEPPLQTLAGILLEMAVQRASRGHLEIGQQAVFVDQSETLDLLRDFERVPVGVGAIVEDRLHLVGRLEEELVRMELQAPGIPDRPVRADAQAQVVGIRVPGRGVVRVVRAHERDPGLPGDLDHSGPNPLLQIGKAGAFRSGPSRRGVIHDLEVVVVLAEDFLVAAGPLHGISAGDHFARHDSLGTRRERDQPFVVFRQEIEVHPRLEIEPLGVGDRAEPHEVPETDAVLREQNQMLVLRIRVLVTPASRRDIGLAPENGFHAHLSGSFVELEGADEIPVIRNRHRRHPLLRGQLDNVGKAAHPVEQRVLGVRVEMNERAVPPGPGTGAAHGSLTPTRSCPAAWR